MKEDWQVLGNIITIFSIMVAVTSIVVIGYMVL